PADDVPRVALLTRRGSCHFGPDITYAKLFQAAEEGAFAFDLSENVGTLFVENIRDWEKRRRWTSTFLQMLWRRWVMVYIKGLVSTIGMPDVAAFRTCSSSGI
ncbi:hypothetical protein FOZ63_009062, partial [Perkinsus olseni]